MFKIIATLTLALLGTLVQAQTIEPRNVTNFNKIKVQDGIEIVYTHSDITSIKVEAPTNSYLAGILTEVKNGTLIIESKNPEIKAIVYITGNDLTGIAAHHGSSFCVTNAIMSERLSISLFDASVFKGNVHAQNLRLDGKQKSTFNIRLEAISLTGNFTGGTKANVSGSARTVELTAGKKSLCHARNLITEKASIDAGENATMLIAANEEIAINLTETSNVTYYGSPRKVSIPEFATAKYKNAGGRMLTVK